MQKKELSDTINRSKMVNSKKTNRQNQLENEYIKSGMLKNEAELAAYKRVKTEKILKVAAGTAIVAASAYVAYKHYDNNVDKLLKSGTKLQNISTNSNKGVADAFYASKNTMDNHKYRGMYGDTLNKGGMFGRDNNSVYETKVKVNNALKVASQKSATDTLKSLVNKDPEYAKKLTEHLEGLSGQMSTEKQRSIVKKGLKSLNDGKVDSKVYEALNLGLVDHSTSGNEISRGFYDALKSKGYGAIKDINDSKYSGFKSSNPMIIFDGGSKTSVDSIRKLTTDEIKKSKTIGMADIVTKELAKQGAMFVGSNAIVKTSIDTYKKKQDNKIISEYRAKHPNSKLSSNEIVRNYNQNK